MKYVYKGVILLIVVSTVGVFTSWMVWGREDKKIISPEIKKEEIVEDTIVDVNGKHARLCKHH